MNEEPSENQVIYIESKEHTDTVIFKVDGKERDRISTEYPINNIMNNLKFRGKRIDNGEWVYGYYLEAEGMHLIKYDDNGVKGLSCVETVISHCYFHEVDPEKVGQFTGLHDKHGNEIYSGDILRICNKEIVTVEWDNDTAGFTAPIEYADWGWDETMVDHIDRVEIIGNKFEHLLSKDLK